jgi:hypothetical protein
MLLVYRSTMLKSFQPPRCMMSNVDRPLRCRLQAKPPLKLCGLHLMPVVSHSVLKTL